MWFCSDLTIDLLISKSNQLHHSCKFLWNSHKQFVKILCRLQRHKMQQHITWISFGNVALNMRVWRSPAGGILSRSTIRRICGSNPMSSIRSASSSTRNLQRSYTTYRIVALNVWSASSFSHCLRSMLVSLSASFQNFQTFHTVKHLAQTNSISQYMSCHSFSAISRQTVVSKNRNNGNIKLKVWGCYLTFSTPTRPLSIMSTSRPGVATSRWQPRAKSRICPPMSAPPYTTHGRMCDR